MGVENLKNVNIINEKASRKNVITHLKYLRKRSALTLENLSQLTGISISYLSRLESGARRLNTDLIKRLSQALDCDPAELLQDTVHDESLFITSSEIRKIRTMNFAREKGRKETKTESRCDLPVYELEKSASGVVTINMEHKSGFRNRPIELMEEKDAICVTAGSALEAHFPEGASVFLVTRKTYIPEMTVLIVTNENEVLLKKVWSVTPNSLQCCDLDKMALLKSGVYNNTSAVSGNNVLSLDKYSANLMEVQNSNVKCVYQVFGYMLQA